MKTICDFIARWMGAMVLLVAALALAVPASFAWIDTWAINPMLGVIMFGMGLTLSPADFKIVLSRPKDILIGCLTQFTVMPLLALGLTWAFALPKELAIGVILVGCCPGGTASNVITYLAKGDLALSVGMTAASTLLAPLMTPLLVWALAGTMVDVDTLGMLMSIVYVVIAPIVCGLLCQRFLPRVTQRVTPYLPAFSSVVIALVVGIIVAHNADRLLTAGLVVVAVVMLHNLLGLTIGFIVGRLLQLPKPKCVALSIEVGMQNSGLASSLAVLHFAAYPLATIPGAVFSVWHNISGALYSNLLKQLTNEARAESKLVCIMPCKEEENLKLTTIMKILILQGSPRANGNTAWMAEEFKNAAEAAGHEVTLVNVAKKKVAGCLACEYCHTKGNGACIQKDDMQELYPLMNEAEVLVLAAPIYYFTLCAQIQAPVQRMYCVNKPANVKKMALLMSSYSPGVYDGATAEFRDICNYWQVENMGFVSAKIDEQKTEETKQKVIALAKAL